MNEPCGLCSSGEHFTNTCHKWDELTPRQIWDLANALPKVANAWQSHYTETTRVSEIWVRLAPHRVESGPTNHIYLDGVAEVFGPINSKWVWKTEISSATVTTKAEAFQRADENLRLAGYRLCGEKEV